ncbi:PH domain-containing protein [Corynebacterium sp.]|uniref:PH domain-containing protein n=1 Tax=Corynebacterium sp. TaxID=1720 RepID=UPI0037BE9A7F
MTDQTSEVSSLARPDSMHRVSGRYVPARYVSDLPWTIVPVIAAVVAALLVPGLASTILWAVAAVLVVLLTWQIWLIPAQASRKRWVETEDELLITKGRLWWTFTVVPYGRIQYVDVTSGPVERAFGIKQVKLHTASSTSDSTVVGLAAVDADALRDRLAVAARERMSGL